MTVVPIVDMKGKKVEEFTIPEKLFSERVNTAVIHQAVVKYRAALRQGNASTKERGAVSGGGVKPYRQKGTGRARAGSSRSPLWHGGGVVFGPHPRTFSYTIPRKIKTAALRETIGAKFQAHDLLCIKELPQTFSKTKEFAILLKTLGLSGRILALCDGCDTSVQRVSRNIAGFCLMRAKDVNAYDILRHKKLLVTRTALEKLIKRIA